MQGHLKQPIITVYMSIWAVSQPPCPLGADVIEERALFTTVQHHLSYDLVTLQTGSK